jgi:RNA polymerase sigma factor (sigma-70 family)
MLLKNFQIDVVFLPPLLLIHSKSKSRIMDDRINDEFIQLVNQNLGIAHKICRVYAMDAEGREDVLQEMMYQLWKSYKSFDGRSKFSTWMYSVCLNTALTYHRKETKQKHQTISTAHYQIANADTENNEAMINLLLDTIATLPPLNKAIMLLYLDDISYEEIATITGLTKSNVGVRIVRIKKDLETEMKKKIKTVEDANI